MHTGFHQIPKLMTLNDFERRGIRTTGWASSWTGPLSPGLAEGGVGLAGRPYKVKHKVNYHNGRHFASFHRINSVALGAIYTTVVVEVRHVSWDKNVAQRI